MCLDAEVGKVREEKLSLATAVNECQLSVKNFESKVDEENLNGRALLQKLKGSKE